MRQHTTLRLSLLSNGYLPIPCHFKAIMKGIKGASVVTDDFLAKANAPIIEANKEKAGKGQPESPLLTGTEKEVVEPFLHWLDKRPRHQSTAIRLTRNFVAIDADYDFQVPEINSAFRRRLLEEFPAFRNMPVRRSGNGTDNFVMLVNVKVAKGDSGVKVMRSNEWFRKGEPNKTVSLEILGGNLKINAFGPRDENSEYCWEGLTPVNIARTSLPELTRDDLGRIGSIFDEVAKKGGLEKLVSSDSGKEGTVQHDLTLETVVDTVEHGRLTLAECIDIAPKASDGSGAEYLRAGGWLFDANRDAKDVLSITNGRRGIQIFDFKTKILHRLISETPPNTGATIPPATNDRIDAEAEQRQRLLDFFAEHADAAEQFFNEGGGGGTGGPPRDPTEGGDDDGDFDREPESEKTIPTDDDEIKLGEAVGWLLRERAWMPTAYMGKGAVVSVYDGGLTILTPTAARMDMAPYSIEREGPRGGIHKINPHDVWMKDTRRIKIQSMQMRPDIRRRIFVENGNLHLNTYVPPKFPLEGGSVWPLMRWLKRLIPDPADRLWFVLWLARKVQKPWTRMITPTFIAEMHGTGRDSLFAVLANLFGHRYVATVPFEKVVGGDSARFNSEMADSLLIVINESRSRDGDERTGASTAYEKLKAVLEPNEGRRVWVERKRQDGIQMRCSVSFILASNNLDIAKITNQDRRLQFIANGLLPTEDEIKAFLAWAANPANLGAVHRFLKGLKVEGGKREFNPYRSTGNELRDDVIDAVKTGFERVFDAAIAKIGEISEIYTIPQLIAAARAINSRLAMNNRFDEVIERMTKRPGYRIGKRNGPNFRPSYPPKSGERPFIYVVDKRHAKKWSNAKPQVIRAQLDKVQKLVTGKIDEKAINDLFTVVKGGKE